MASAMGFRGAERFLFFMVLSYTFCDELYTTGAKYTHNIYTYG